MKNVFVHTRNVKQFASAMSEALLTSGEETLLVFHGQAGRGKTTAARFYAAQEGWTYTRCVKGWKSELWMLQDLCFELKVDPVPGRKKRCFEAVRDRLLADPRPMLVDEADKLPTDQLEWIRDLVDLTLVPWALIGEKELVPKMSRTRRIWSRTRRVMEFGPISSDEVLYFAAQTADIRLTAGQGEAIRKASDGDFRLARQAVAHLEGLIGANRGPRTGADGRVNDDMVKTALSQVFRGRTNG